MLSKCSLVWHRAIVCSLSCIASLLSPWRKLQAYLEVKTSTATTADSGSSDILRSDRIAGGSLPTVLNSLYMLANFLTEPWQQGLVIIAVIAFSLLLSILRFRVTQNFVNIVFVAYGGAILLIGLAGLLSLGHPAPVDYSAPHWAPTWGNATFYGT